MKTFTLAIRLSTVIALSFLMVQCGNKQTSSNQSANDGIEAASFGTKLPIAYINVDSLLSKYNYAKDLNEKMINKQENARASINEKARQLKKEQDDFQRKYQNNAFLSPERAQQEYQRLEKKAADLQEYAQRLENENLMEQQKMLMQMNDSINNFIKEYNADKKYEAIFNNASTLYINPEYDITNEVVELLNKRYTKK
ncbi:MAG TPA: OmpH family outer membrane protein [Candidatus Barnesiella excrementigallinarum]|nr:OmpH family outer membrane protein [Candidatus Barnesiella excrementigallinarum]